MSDQSRRKLLKSIAAGSGAIVAGKSLPESWAKPVVDSVMLPAHAETSITSYSDMDIPIPNMNGSLVNPNQDNMVADFFNFFTPEAKAGGPNIDSVSGCAEVGASVTEVTLREVLSGSWSCEEFGHDLFTLDIKASIPSGEGNSGPVTLSSPCVDGDIVPPGPTPPDMKIVKLTSSEIILGIGDTEFTLPASPCMLVEDSCVVCETMEEIPPNE